MKQEPSEKEGLSSSTPTAVVFDIGNVLVRWSPEAGYHQRFAQDPAARDYFFTHVCSPDWNGLLDEGRCFAEIAPPLVEKFPAYRDHILAWPDVWPDMFTGVLDESVAILKELKARKTPLYALTNWPAEYFPLGEATFPFLSLFDGKVVSGYEKTRKPYPTIYRILLDRFHLTPQETLFIDDRSENIEGAKRLGIQTHLFRAPQTLRDDLISRDLL